MTITIESRSPVPGRSAARAAVTTLHTILATTESSSGRVMDEIAERSGRLVVMTARGAELLFANLPKGAS